MLELVFWKFVTHYGLTQHIEIICRQGHRSETVITSSSVMHHVVTADDDFLRRKLPSTILYRRLICIGEKANDPATRPYPARIDLRQRFVEALHPEPIQVDLRQLSLEAPPSGGVNLNISGANSRLIRNRVRKMENFARTHDCPRV